VEDLEAFEKLFCVDSVKSLSKQYERNFQLFRQSATMVDVYALEERFEAIHHHMGMYDYQY
jgi:hypothetical protein